MQSALAERSTVGVEIATNGNEEHKGTMPFLNKI
jgi:hypothetical protein